jgi:hypothetical protein
MKTKRNILLHSAFLLLFIIILLLTYAPVTKGHYFCCEDYGNIWTSEEQLVNNQSYVEHLREMVWEGRPLETLYYYFIFNKFINALRSVEAANFARLIGVIGIGLLAYVLFLIFKTNRFRTDHAFLLSILICTLPPIQTYVGRVHTVILIYCVLLSALAALIMFKALFREDRNKTAMAMSVLIAMILFIMSLNIYQPAAMTYWAIAVIPFIIIRDEDFTKKRALFFAMYCSVGFASMLIYMGITKIIGLQLNLNVSYRGVLIHRGEIYDRIIWFINYPLYGALNLWNIFPVKKVALFVGIPIVFGMLYGFGRVVFKIIVEKKGGILLWRYLIILPLIPLSFLTNIVSSNLHEPGIPLHRYFIALETILLLLLYWGSINITDFFKSAFNFSADLQKKILSIGLLILTVGATFLANHNVDKYFTTLHTNELKYTKNMIQEYGIANLSKDTNIIVITPDKHSRYEFGVLSSLGYVSSISMVRLALYELGINLDIPVEFINFNEQPNRQLPEGENILVIDMRKFLRKALKPTEFVVY